MGPLLATWPYLTAVLHTVIAVVATGHAVLHKRDTRAAIGLKFLRRLRLRPLEIPVPAERLWEHLTALPWRIDVVLLPLPEEPQRHFGGLRQVGWVWAARSEGHSFLGIPLAGDRLYRACIEVGLAFDRRQPQVRRAFCRASTGDP